MGFLSDVIEKNNEHNEKIREKNRQKRLAKENKKKLKNIDVTTKDWAKTEVDKVKDDLYPVLGEDGILRLRKTLTIIANNEGFEEALEYLNYTVGRVNYYSNKQNDYLIEAKLADKIYKSYVTDGISRIDKVNGRFMAAQNMKLDLLIEQNTKIIELLEKIAKKQ